MLPHELALSPASVIAGALALIAVRSVIDTVLLTARVVRAHRRHQPLAGVGNAHQCRMHKAARENRNGVEFQLYRCAECDQRRWYEEGSSADTAPR